MTTINGSAAVDATSVDPITTNKPSSSSSTVLPRRRSKKSKQELLSLLSSSIHSASNSSSSSASIQLQQHQNRHEQQHPEGSSSQHPQHPQQQQQQQLNQGKYQQLLQKSSTTTTTTVPIRSAIVQRHQQQHLLQKQQLEPIQQRKRPSSSLLQSSNNNDNNNNNNKTTSSLSRFLLPSSNQILRSSNSSSTYSSGIVEDNMSELLDQQQAISDDPITVPSKTFTRRHEKHQDSIKQQPKRVTQTTLLIQKHRESQNNSHHDSMHHDNKREKKLQMSSSVLSPQRETASPQQPQPQQQQPQQSQQLNQILQQYRSVQVDNNEQQQRSANSTALMNVKQRHQQQQSQQQQRSKQMNRSGSLSPPPSSRAAAVQNQQRKQQPNDRSGSLSPPPTNRAKASSSSPTAPPTAGTTTKMPILPRNSNRSTSLSPPPPNRAASSSPAPAKGTRRVVESSLLATSSSLSSSVDTSLRNTSSSRAKVIESTNNISSTIREERSIVAALSSSRPIMSRISSTQQPPSSTITESKQRKQVLFMHKQHQQHDQEQQQMQQKKQLQQQQKDKLKIFQAQKRQLQMMQQYTRPHHHHPSPSSLLTTGKIISNNDIQKTPPIENVEMVVVTGDTKTEIQRPDGTIENFMTMPTTKHKNGVVKERLVSLISTPPTTKQKNHHGSKHHELRLSSSPLAVSSSVAAISPFASSMMMHQHNGFYNDSSPMNHNGNMKSKSSHSFINSSSFRLAGMGLEDLSMTSCRKVSVVVMVNFPDNYDKPIKAVIMDPTTTANENINNNKKPSSDFNDDDRLCVFPNLTEEQRTLLSQTIALQEQKEVTEVLNDSANTTKRHFYHLLAAPPSRDLVVVNPEAFGRLIPSQVTIDTARLVAQVSNIPSEDWARNFRFNQVIWPGAGGEVQRKSTTETTGNGVPSTSSASSLLSPTTCLSNMVSAMVNDVLSDHTTIDSLHRRQQQQQSTTPEKMLDVSDIQKQLSNRVVIAQGDVKSRLKTLFGNVGKESVAKVMSQQPSSMPIDDIIQRYGIIGLTLHRMLERIPADAICTLSILEICDDNEVHDQELFDLLAVKPHRHALPQDKRVRISYSTSESHDQYGNMTGAVVTGLSETTMDSLKSLNICLRRAFAAATSYAKKKQKSYKGTRGHIIATLKVIWNANECNLHGGDGDEMNQPSYKNYTVCQFVDMSQLQLDNSPECYRHDANVRKSMWALGGVLRGYTNTKQNHNNGSMMIAYRESTITKVLQRSMMTDDSRIIVIATISPLSSKYDETITTLRYVNRLLYKSKQTLPQSPFEPSASSSSVAGSPTSYASSSCNNNVAGGDDIAGMIDPANQKMMKSDEFIRSLVCDPRQRLAKLIKKKTPHSSPTKPKNLQSALTAAAREEYIPTEYSEPQSQQQQASRSASQFFTPSEFDHNMLMEQKLKLRQREHERRRRRQEEQQDIIIDKENNNQDDEQQTKNLHYFSMSYDSDEYDGESNNDPEQQTSSYGYYECGDDDRIENNDETQQGLDVLNGTAGINNDDIMARHSRISSWSDNEPAQERNGDGTIDTSSHLSPINNSRNHPVLRTADKSAVDDLEILTERQYINDFDAYAMLPTPVVRNSKLMAKELRNQTHDMMKNSTFLIDAMELGTDDIDTNEVTKADNSLLWLDRSTNYNNDNNNLPSPLITDTGAADDTIDDKSAVNYYCYEPDLLSSTLGKFHHDRKIRGKDGKEKSTGSITELSINNVPTQKDPPSSHTAAVDAPTTSSSSSSIPEEHVETTTVAASTLPNAINSNKHDLVSSLVPSNINLQKEQHSRRIPQQPPGLTPSSRYTSSITEMPPPPPPQISKILSSDSKHSVNDDDEVINEDTYYDDNENELYLHRHLHDDRDQSLLFRTTPTSHHIALSLDDVPSVTWANDDDYQQHDYDMNNLARNLLMQQPKNHGILNTTTNNTSVQNMSQNPKYDDAFLQPSAERSPQILEESASDNVEEYSKLPETNLSNLPPIFKESMVVQQPYNGDIAVLMHEAEASNPTISKPTPSNNDDSSITSNQKTLKADGVMVSQPSDHNGHIRLESTSDELNDVSALLDTDISNCPPASATSRKSMVVQQVSKDAVTMCKQEVAPLNAFISKVTPSSNGDPSITLNQKKLKLISTISFPSGKSMIPEDATKKKVESPISDRVDPDMRSETNVRSMPIASPSRVGNAGDSNTNNLLHWFDEACCSDTQEAPISMPMRPNRSEFTETSFSDEGEAGTSSFMDHDLHPSLSSSTSPTVETSSSQRYSLTSTKSIDLQKKITGDVAREDNKESAGCHQAEKPKLEGANLMFTTSLRHDDTINVNDSPTIAIESTSNAIASSMLSYDEIDSGRIYDTLMFINSESGDSISPFANPKEATDNTVSASTTNQDDKLLSPSSLSRMPCAPDLITEAKNDAMNETTDTKESLSAERPLVVCKEEDIFNHHDEVGASVPFDEMIQNSLPSALNNPEVTNHSHQFMDKTPALSVASHQSTAADLPPWRTSLSEDDMRDAHLRHIQLAHVDFQEKTDNEFVIQNLAPDVLPEIFEEVDSPSQNRTKEIIIYSKPKLFSPEMWLENSDGPDTLSCGDDSADEDTQGTVFPPSCDVTSPLSYIPVSTHSNNGVYDDYYDFSDVEKGSTKEESLESQPNLKPFETFFDSENDVESLSEQARSEVKAWDLPNGMLELEAPTIYDLPPDDVAVAIVDPYLHPINLPISVAAPASLESMNDAKFSDDNSIDRISSRHLVQYNNASGDERAESRLSDLEKYSLERKQIASTRTFVETKDSTDMSHTASPNLITSGGSKDQGDPRRNPKFNSKFNAVFNSGPMYLSDTSAETDLAAEDVADDSSFWLGSQRSSHRKISYSANFPATQSMVSQLAYTTDDIYRNDISLIPTEEEKQLVNDVVNATPMSSKSNQSESLRDSSASDVSLEVIDTTENNLLRRRSSQQPSVEAHSHETAIADENSKEWENVQEGSDRSSVDNLKLYEDNDMKWINASISSPDSRLSKISRNTNNSEVVPNHGKRRSNSQHSPAVSLVDRSVLEEIDELEAAVDQINKTNRDVWKTSLHSLGNLRQYQFSQQEFLEQLVAEREQSEMERARLQFDLDKAMEQHQNDIFRLENELATSLVTVERIEGDRNELVKIAEEAIATQSDLEQKVLTLEQDLSFRLASSVSRDKFDVVSDENVTLTHRIHEMDRITETQRIQIEEFQAALAEMKNTIKKFEIDSRSMKDEYVRLRDENDHLKDELEHANAIAKDAERLSREVSRLDTDLAHIKVTGKKRDAEMTDLISSKDELIGQLEEDSAKANSNLRQLHHEMQVQLKKGENEIFNLKEQLKESRNSYRQLGEQLNASTKSNTFLASELDHAQTEQAKLIAQIECLKVDLINALAANERDKAKIIKMEKALEEFRQETKSRVEQVVKHRNDATSRLKTALKENQVLSQSNNKLQNELDELKEDQEAMRHQFCLSNEVHEDVALLNESQPRIRAAAGRTRSQPNLKNIFYDSYDDHLIHPLGRERLRTFPTTNSGLQHDRAEEIAAFLALTAKSVREQRNEEVYVMKQQLHEIEDAKNAEIDSLIQRIRSLERRIGTNDFGVRSNDGRNEHRRSLSYRQSNN